MSGTTNIYVQCNPLLDVTLDVTPDFLARHNLERDEEHIYYSRFKGLFEEMQASGQAVTTPGGAGLNTARVAQWVLNKHISDKQGAFTSPPAPAPKVYYVGCVGNDANGKELRRQAEEDGVHMCLEVTERAPTGMCAVCKLGESRSMVANLGAANEMSSSFLASAVVQDALKDAGIVFTTAYASPFHVKETLDLAVATRAHNVDADGDKDTRPMFAFGLSSKNMMEVFGEDLVDLLNKMDCIFGNRDELLDLAAILQWDPEERLTDAQLVAKLAKEMMYDDHTVRRVVMTRGIEPVLWATSAGTHGEVPVLNIQAGSHKHRRTGAGDAFIGGFLAAAAAGHRGDVRRCVEVGVQAASYTVQKSIKNLRKEDAPAL